MIKKPFEGFLGFICDYWWIFAILLVIALALYFTRQYWLPLLGLL
jgi:hypothetical protein